MERRFFQRQHICSFYESPEERLRMASSYVTEGLALGEQCLYVASTDTDVDDFRVWLLRCGTDISASEQSGALQLRTSAEAHLQHGYFDAERTLTLLEATLRDALGRGFAGLRICSDMSGLVGQPPGASRLVEYELLLNSFFKSLRALGMCQYDRQRLSRDVVANAVSTHTVTLGL